MASAKPSVLAAAVLAALCAMGDAAARAGDDRTLCRSRFDYLNRYEFSGGSRRDSGVKLRSEIARALCETGRTGEGIAMLESELRRALLPLPPRQ